MSVNRGFVGNMEDFKKFLFGSSYEDLLDEISKQAKIDIYPEYTSMELRLDIQRLTYSKLSLEQLEEFIKSNRRFIVEYSVSKLNQVKDDIHISENDEIEEEGYSKSFIYFDIIEIILLQGNGKELKSYFKKVRIPNRLQYIKEIKDIYEGVQG